MPATSCPTCGSTRIYRSRRRNPIERFLSLFGSRMRRCHDCGARYAHLSDSLIRVDNVRLASKRFYLAVAMAAAALLLTGAVLWFSRQPAPVAETGSLAQVLIRT